MATQAGVREGPAAIGQPAFLEWAERGFSAELVPVRGKVPTGAAWQHRVVTPEMVEEWARVNGANVGLRTRAFPTIDIDVDDAGIADACAALVVEELGSTFVRHRNNSPRRAVVCRLAGEPFKKSKIEFTAPDGSEHKVEFLASGQQVVVAGRHATGATLEWSPRHPVAAELPELTGEKRDALTSRLCALLVGLGCTVKGAAPAVKPLPRAQPEVSDDDRDRDLARQALDNLSPDTTYDEWTKVGMALHAKWPAAGGTGLDLWDWWSSRGDKYPGRSQLETKWSSFHAGGGVSFGTLLHLGGVSPKAAPRIRLAPEPDGSEPDTDVGEATMPDLEVAEAAPTKGPRIEVAYLPALELGKRLFDVKLPRTEYVVEPFVPRREVIEVSGPHGHMKSSVTLNLLLSVATGRSWGGVPVIQGATAFVTLEDTEAVIQARTLAFLAAIEDPEERADAELAIGAHFTYLTREKAQPLVLTYTEGARNTLVMDRVVEHFVRIFEGRTLVALETSSRLHPGPEDHVGLAALATAAERIATATGAATAVGRHHTKSSAREGAGDSYAGSGAAVFSNAARSVLTIEQDGRRKPKPGEEPEERDPFAIVRLRQTKAPPLAAPGSPLAWRPTLVDTSVGRHLHLAALSSSDEAREAGLKLLRFLHENGEVTKTDLHKAPPCGLSREVAKDAMEMLLAQGKVRLREVEGRGKTKQKAWVWTLS